ncbi:MAG: helix-turn-helix domain-containing protein [Proteobacteria bacterium]|nr:helix-turn-helix domain-containing protein [Pseudomonadota bacterium]MBU1714355.1 helix-turn-helix domain-containing protein [Pseudomonadota bacterium]
MGKRHPNHRLVKTHRSYTVEEIADLFGIHKNTVHNWVKKNGLAPIDSKRPTLIQGIVLVEFLKERRTKNKQTCKPGELYCVRCRVPRPAGEDMAEYSPVNEKTGNLMAICPVCDAIMNRRVSLAKIGEVSGNIDITFPEELRHIVDSLKPSVNCDLR